MRKERKNRANRGNRLKENESSNHKPNQTGKDMKSQRCLTG